MQHLPKVLMCARSSIGYGLSVKQVACPRYGWYGGSSGWNIGGFDSANAILDPPVDEPLLLIEAKSSI